MNTSEGLSLQRELLRSGVDFNYIELLTYAPSFELTGNDFILMIMDIFKDILPSSHYNIKAFLKKGCFGESANIIIRSKPINVIFTREGEWRELPNEWKELYTEFQDELVLRSIVSPLGIAWKGMFDKSSGRLLSGYYVNAEGELVLVNNAPLISIALDSDSKEVLETVDMDGEIKVLRRACSYSQSCELIEYSIIKLALMACKREGRQGLGKVFQYKNFPLDEFLLQVFCNPAELFNFSLNARLEIIKAAVLNKFSFDPSEIIFANSSDNLYFYAARNEELHLLDLLLIHAKQHSLQFDLDGLIKIILLEECFFWPLALIDETRFDNMFEDRLDDFQKSCLFAARRKKPNHQFTQQFDSLTLGQRQNVLDVAWNYKNTYIYQLGAVPKVDQVSINMIWVPKRPRPNQLYLLGDGDIEEEQAQDFCNKLVTPLKEWDVLNSSVLLNVWYDSKLTNADVVDRSFEYVVKETRKGSNCSVNVHFNDIRSLEEVSENPNAFDPHPTSLWVRIDALKMIILFRQALDGVTYPIFTDLDVEPMSLSQIFNRQTVNSLDDLFGIVLAREPGITETYENSFMLIKSGKVLLNALNDFFIKPALEFLSKMIIKRSSQQQQYMYKLTFECITRIVEQDGRYGDLDSSRCVTESSKYFPFKDGPVYFDIKKGSGRKEAHFTTPFVAPISHFGKPREYV